MFGLFSRKKKADNASQRQSVPVSLRYTVLVRDKFRCVDCGRSPAKDDGVTLQIDHVLPVSHGGKNELSNLATRCSDCNAGKGVRVPECNTIPMAPPNSFWVSISRTHNTPIHSSRCRYHKMGGGPDRLYYSSLDHAKQSHPDCELCRRCLGDEK